MGILNTEADHAKTIGLEESSSTIARGKNAHKIDQEALKGCNKVLGKDENGENFGKY